MNSSLPPRALLALALWLLSNGLAGHLVAAEPPAFDQRLVDTLAARPLGPANMGGRIVSLAVVPSDPKQMYVATASGGLWKTQNNGTTWRPIFDQQNTVSLGDVAVAPSSPEIVWVGTGEANARNSVSWGDGVYRSPDGGRSWQHRGLADTEHIGRIVIHPTNPDIVYVAALGHLWGLNRSRGIFKTTDGGDHWQHVGYYDDSTGFIDLVMDPSDPRILYTAAYQVRRDDFSGGNPKVQFGPGAGIYRTTDGGENWYKLSHGLPQSPCGRIGLDIYRKDPRIVYAVIQTEKTDIRTIAGQEAKSNNRVETGGVFRSENRGETWTKLNDLCPRPFYYGQIRIDPNTSHRIYVLGIELHVSSDGGQTFQEGGAARIHSDHHALWIDPRDSEHLVLGCDGGLNLSYDRGQTWEHMANLPIGQFYGIAVDARKPYRVYGGLQDNGTWSGPSRTHSSEGITTADWTRLYGADGFHCQIDPEDPDLVYAEGQYGQLRRFNVRTGSNDLIRPAPPKGAPAYRFNWSSPLLLSSHPPRALYFGGNHLFRSTDRGLHWETISPDLTRGQPGPSADFGHTLTAVAESPVKAGVLYAGTDDGRVHVTKNNGKKWADVSDHLRDAPSSRWITSIECSHFEPGTAYLTLDRHRQDDRRPFVFKTTDFGETWQPLAGLPVDGPVHVIREDLRNPALLFVGTEFGLYVSLTGGKNWQRVTNGLPTVAVPDLVIHPRDRELVIATHGRSLFVLDIAPLQEFTTEVHAREVHLFDIKPAPLYEPRGGQGRQGDKAFMAPNPPVGAVLYYYLRSAVPSPPEIEILDAAGKVVVKLSGPQSGGLHQVLWDLRRPKADMEVGPRVPPGEYQVRFTAGDLTLAKSLRVEAEE
jgi:photosystem II stability/assembly factor-like uncharacterized protein